MAWKFVGFRYFYVMAGRATAVRSFCMLYSCVAILDRAKSADKIVVTK